MVAPTAAQARALRARLERALTRGYDELFVLAPAQLAAVLLDGDPEDGLDGMLSAGDRLAMLLERVDELSLARHDIGGSLGALLAGFVRRIDRLKAELIGAEDYAPLGGGARASSGADPAEAALQLEFAEVYRTHERMLAETETRDARRRRARCAARARSAGRPWPQRFEHVLVDDIQELDLAAVTLVQALAGAAPHRRRRSPARSAALSRAPAPSASLACRPSPVPWWSLADGHRCPERVLGRRGRGSCRCR